MINSHGTTSSGEGNLISLRPLSRTPYFVVAIIVAVIAILLDLYTIFAHRPLLLHRKLLLYPILTLFQVINIWIRFFRYRSLLAGENNEGYVADRSEATKIQAIAVAGMTELILLSFLLVVLLLFYAESILA